MVRWWLMMLLNWYACVSCMYFGSCRAQHLQLSVWPRSSTHTHSLYGWYYVYVVHYQCPSQDENVCCTMNLCRAQGNKAKRQDVRKCDLNSISYGASRWFKCQTLQPQPATKSTTVLTYWCLYLNPSHRISCCCIRCTMHTWRCSKVTTNLARFPNKLSQLGKHSPTRASTKSVCSHFTFHNAR